MSIKTGQTKWKDVSTSLEVPLLSKDIKQDVKNPFLTLKKMVKKLRFEKDRLQTKTLVHS